MMRQMLQRVPGAGGAEPDIFDPTTRAVMRVEIEGESPMDMEYSLGQDRMRLDMPQEVSVISTTVPCSRHAHIEPGTNVAWHSA